MQRRELSAPEVADNESTVSSVDTHRIERAIKEILLAIGEDPTREGLTETPRRIAQAYEFLFSGLSRDPAAAIDASFHEDYAGMVVLKDIQFFSMCEHHLLPFWGMAHVGYIPSGEIVGASKLARVIETLAKRPQLQERLTDDAAATIAKVIKPQGVAVVVEAEHMCIAMRGIQKPGSRMITSAMRGLFLSDPRTRNEFMAIATGQR
ncbi:MAG: GTP cyclohydrolase I FolE [Chloroflexota bacterium]|nr:GTP cyclohydrolase I FolE [Chloroflexota bacterium]MDE2840063.1 GTP cyclohydrolase I FolE [Chloroflexota bacterium]MDE2930270.1 GTP cyclohydrolase I FolE [Chloroflexota bacterium]